MNSQILNVTHERIRLQPINSIYRYLGYRVGGFSGGRNCQPLADGAICLMLAALGREDVSITISMILMGIK
jgi:hypothetical protein